MQELVVERREPSTRVRRATFSDQERAEILKLLSTRSDRRRQLTEKQRRRETERARERRRNLTGEALLEWRKRHAENARRRRAAVLQERIRLQHRVNRTLSLQQYPKEIPFRCGICPRNFNNRWQLSQHRNRSHRQDDGQYICDVCGKATSKVRDMVLHKRGRHNMAFPGNFPTIDDIAQDTHDMQRNLQFVLPPHHPAFYTSMPSKLNSSDLLSNSFQQSNFTNYLARYGSQSTNKYLPNQSDMNTESNSTPLERNELTGSSYKTLTEYIKQNETSRYDTRFDSSICYQPIHHFEKIVDQESLPLVRQEYFNRNYSTFLTTDSIQNSQADDQGYKFPTHILQQNSISNENTMLESEYLSHGGIAQSYKWGNPYMRQLNQASHTFFSATEDTMKGTSLEKMERFSSDFAKNLINHSSDIDEGDSYGLKIVSVESQQNEIVNSDSKTFSILQPSLDKSVMSKVMSNKFTDNWTEFESKATSIIESVEEIKETMYSELSSNVNGNRHFTCKTSSPELKNTSDIVKTKVQNFNEQSKSHFSKSVEEQTIAQSEGFQYNQSVSDLKIASVCATKNTLKSPFTTLSCNEVIESPVCCPDIDRIGSSGIVMSYDNGLYNENSPERSTVTKVRTHRKTTDCETISVVKTNDYRDDEKNNQNGKCQYQGYNSQNEEVQKSYNNLFQKVPIPYERKDAIKNPQETHNSIYDRKYINMVSQQSNSLHGSLKLHLDATHRMECNIKNIAHNINNAEVTIPQVSRPTSVTTVENKQITSSKYAPTYQCISEQDYNMQAHYAQNNTFSNSDKSECRGSHNTHVDAGKSAGVSVISSEKVIPNCITYFEGKKTSEMCCSTKAEQNIDNEDKHTVQYDGKMKNKNSHYNLSSKTEVCSFFNEFNESNKIKATNDVNYSITGKKNLMILKDGSFSKRSENFESVQNKNILPATMDCDGPTTETRSNADVSIKNSVPVQETKTNTKTDKVENELNYNSKKIFYGKDENNFHGLREQSTSKERPKKETVMKVVNSNIVKSRVPHCRISTFAVKKDAGNSSETFRKTVAKKSQNENNAASVLKEIISNDIEHQNTPLTGKIINESIQDYVPKNTGRITESMRTYNDLKSSFPQPTPTKYESILVQNENQLPKIKIRNILGKLPDNRVQYGNLNFNKNNAQNVSPQTKISLANEPDNTDDRKEISKNSNYDDKEKKRVINKPEQPMDSHNLKGNLNVSHQMKDIAIRGEVDEPTALSNSLKDDGDLKTGNIRISVFCNEKKDVATPQVEETESEITTVFQVVKEVEPTGTFVYVCLPCELILRTPEEYDTHQESQHRPSGNKLDGKRMDIQLKKTTNDVYICRVCAAVFKSRKSLQKHTRLKHRDAEVEKKRKISREKNHVCEVCGRKFVFGHLLQDHVNTHTGDTPYSCIVCGTRLSMRSELMCHVKLHRHPYTVS